MDCLICRTRTTGEDQLCTPRCAREARRELSGNRERLGGLRRSGRPPCGESRGLMDRNSQLLEALRRVEQPTRV